MDSISGNQTFNLLSVFFPCPLFRHHSTLEYRIKSINENDKAKYPRFVSLFSPFIDFVCHSNESEKWSWIRINMKWYWSAPNEVVLRFIPSVWPITSSCKFNWIQFVRQHPLHIVIKPSHDSIEIMFRANIITSPLSTSGSDSFLLLFLYICIHQPKLFIEIIKLHFFALIHLSEVI